MKLSWLIIIGLFFSLFQMRMCNKSRDVELGEIVVYPTTVIFSEEDGLSNKVVEITNNSNKRLFIHPIEASCPCISVDFDNSILKPGEKREISLSYSGGYNSPARYSIYIKIGPVRKKESGSIHLLTVDIKSNYSQDNDYRQVLQLIPSSIDFGKIEKDCVESQFSIVNTGESSIYIEDLYTSCVCITTDFDNAKGKLLPGEKRDIHIYYNSHGNVEPVHFSISVKADISSKPYIVDLFANR